jgi:hypothetical protein
MPTQPQNRDGWDGYQVFRGADEEGRTPNLLFTKRSKHGSSQFVVVRIPRDAAQTPDPMFIPVRDGSLALAYALAYETAAFSLAKLSGDSWGSSIGASCVALVAAESSARNSPAFLISVPHAFDVIGLPLSFDGTNRSGGLGRNAAFDRKEAAGLDSRRTYPGPPDAGRSPPIAQQDQRKGY